jgi:hypothetical protein
MVLTAVIVFHFKNMMVISSRVVSDQKMVNDGIYPIVKHDFPDVGSDDYEQMPGIDRAESTLSKK